MLTVDIGNSNISFGVFQSDKLIHSFTASTTSIKEPNQLQELIEAELQAYDIHSSFLASVVPGANQALIDLIKNITTNDSHVISHQDVKDFKTSIKELETLGIDRLMNAVATSAIYPLPAIIVDLGTAITIDYISDDSTFLGGVILPGPKTALEALAEKAACLWEVKFEQPDHVIGNNTVSALQSGSFYGSLIMIEGMIAKFQEEQGTAKKIIFTGGLAPFFTQSASIDIEHHKDLTLYGIYQTAKQL